MDSLTELLTNKSLERYLLSQAYEVALESPDPSTQNGAVLVRPDTPTIIRAKGFNRFPRGIAYTNERWQRPLKYRCILHAETNAIYDATRQGVSTVGMVLICCWAACSECAKAMIETGIVALITHDDAHVRNARDRDPNDPSLVHWKEEILLANQFFSEAQRAVIFYRGKIGATPVRMDGKLWHP